MKRKTLSKKLRFEVFKRDSFKCQYCGASSPEAVLHVDHIKPVSKGGTNDLLNLITSCSSCNLGKGARELGDHTTIKKQKNQLDELNERREQLEMLMEWKDTLKDIVKQEVDYVDELVQEYTGFNLNQEELNSVRSMIRRYGFEEVYESMQITLEKGDIENIIQYCWRVLAVRKRQKEEPSLYYINYLKKTFENRLEIYNSARLSVFLETECINEREFDRIKQMIIDARNWTDFWNLVNDFYGEY